MHYTTDSWNNYTQTIDSNRFQLGEMNRVTEHRKTVQQKINENIFFLKAIRLRMYNAGMVYFCCCWYRPGEEQSQITCLVSKRIIQWIGLTGIDY